MIFQIEKYDAHGIIKEIASRINKPALTDCAEEFIELPEEVGSGKIAGFNFSSGISLLVFSCSLTKDWILNFKDDAPAPFQFNFAVKGNIHHCFHKNRIQHTMNPLQGTITAHSTGGFQNIKLGSNTELLFTILFIDRKTYSKKIVRLMEHVPQELKEAFMDANAERCFFYQSNYSMSITNSIQQIVEDDQTGLVRSIFIEGKALELFSKQIKQYNEDKASPLKSITLRKSDLEKIQQAEKILVQDFSKPPTIEKLAKLVGINQQKLKQGFRKIYDTTINNYLRVERMEASSNLLLKGKSVREVASEVGYSNQSHFAKRFREQYGVLPREYLKTVRSKVV